MATVVSDARVEARVQKRKSMGTICTHSELVERGLCRLTMGLNENTMRTVS